MCARATIIPIGMNDENLRRRIADIAATSDLVRFSYHARSRMRQRLVTDMQVLSVLRAGVVVEPAHRNLYGNWQCTLEHRVAGDRIKVAAALMEDGGEWVVVVTVIRA